MILSDTTLRQKIITGRIKFIPDIKEHNIRPTGVRIHLGNELLLPTDGQIVDFSEPSELRYEKIDLAKKDFFLMPGMFVLGSTHEKVLMPTNMVGHIEGRSTVARVGMAIHCTSGIIDSMHDEPRVIVLEIKNWGNFALKLKPYMPIGMLIFSELTSDIAQGSQAQYRNQTTAVAPNLYFQPKGVEDD